jgi:hypothetical protein
MHFRTKIAWLGGFMLLLVSGLAAAQPSPAVCGAKDTPEPGTQGGTAATPAGFNCGLSLVGEFPVSGNMEIKDHCAYVRSGSSVAVFDVTDPTLPVQKTTVPISGSETYRLVVAPDRALIVGGTDVYDVTANCEQPVHKGNIQWPGGGGNLNLNHDLRLSHDAKRVFATLGLGIADISDLDQASWTGVNYTCYVGKQEGFLPYQGPVDPCRTPVLDNSSWLPAIGHGADDNTASTRLYIGAVTGDCGIISDTVPARPLCPLTGLPGNGMRDEATSRILDVTDPANPLVLDRIAGGSYSVDWFRSASDTGREYILHGEEGGTGDTCQPLPRPAAFGWAYDAYITEVTGDTMKRVATFTLNTNKPENCTDGGQRVTRGYMTLENQDDAHFAMISWGGAGLRVYDVRDPNVPGGPQEVAYFNRDGAGKQHPYDAKRGLLYTDGKVLEVQPQVYDKLGMPHPTDPAYPRYPDGRPATP